MRALIASTILISPFAATARADEPPSDLAKVVAAAIKLLEAEQYGKFIATYAHPGELKKLLQTRTMEELVRKVAKNKSKHLVAALKRIQSLEPKLSESGKKATYLIKIPDRTAKQSMVFEKVDNVWRIRN